MRAKSNSTNPDRLQRHRICLLKELPEQPFRQNDSVVAQHLHNFLERKYRLQHIALEVARDSNPIPGKNRCGGNASCDHSKVSMRDELPIYFLPIALSK